MKQLFTLTFLCLSPLAALAQANCQQALAVTPGIHNVMLLSGTQLPQPVCTSGQQNTPDRGAWFAYTPTDTYTANVKTYIEGYPVIDTRVHIYTGTCGSLTCVGGDDDSGPEWTSDAYFTAEEGITYYIAFDNNWNNSSFSFKLTESTFVPSIFSQQSITLQGDFKSCITDMNGDYLDDIVSPLEGAVAILYQNPDGSGFTPATLTAPATNNMPGWSMAAGDFDKNGYNDLLYGNGNGTAILLANDDGTAFSDIHESGVYVFSQRTNFIDINNDGHLDAFICHDIAPNVYYLNDGEGGYTFEQGGLGDYSTGGNYGSIWIDYDNDGDMDLFIAKCRGGGANPAAVDELHRNNGDGTFTNVANEANFSDFQQSWSSAWGDFDNDGDMDVLIGANSDSDGGHKLMRNNGDGTFTNVTEGSGFDTNQLLNIEHVTHDFDNDGYLDILGGGSTIMFNSGDMTFTPAGITASNGPIGDLNNDGFLDIQNGNSIFLNNGNDNNWIKIHLEGVNSNRNGIGARVEVYADGDGWEKQIRDVKSGDGFRYMSSLNSHFGIGQTEEIEQVVIKWPSGIIDVINNPDINEPLLVVEGSTILSQPEFTANGLILYPNPAKDVVNINSDTQMKSAVIYDINGRLVQSAAINQNTIDVQNLTKGTYFIIIEDTTGKQHSSKIIKE